MSEAIAERESATPALAYNASTEVTTEDIALPRIKLGQHMSEHVQEKRVEFASIFSELGPDDPEPVTLSDGKKPVRFYVLAGPVKGWSYSEPGEDLETWRFDDPNRHPDAWVTYKYVIAVPKGETELPYSILLTRTSAPAAKQLNTILTKAAQHGPTEEVALELNTAQKRKGPHQWAIAQIRRASVPEKDKAKDLAIVKDLIGLARASSAARTPAESNEPTVTEEPAI